LKKKKKRRNRRNIVPLMLKRGIGDACQERKKKRQTPVFVSPPRTSKQPGGKRKDINLEAAKEGNNKSQRKNFCSRRRASYLRTVALKVTIKLKSTMLRRRLKGTPRAEKKNAKERQKRTRSPSFKKRMSTHETPPTSTTKDRGDIGNFFCLLEIQTVNGKKSRATVTVPW